ncbi:MAG: beta-galactosidase trimerization domain-containing protein [Victivallales bacterium]
MRILAITMMLFAVFISGALPLSGENLVPDGDFESGPWYGNGWAGEGKATLMTDEPHAGKASMGLIGTSSDAQIQTISKDITVESGNTYAFSFWYRLKGYGSLDVRWNGDGYVFTLKDTGGKWVSSIEALKTGMATAIRYTKGLGNIEGREAVKVGEVFFPDGTRQVKVIGRLSGIGVLELDDISLESSVSATSVRYENAPKTKTIEQEEIERLLINTNEKPVLVEKPKSDVRLEIQDVVLPESYEMSPERFPERATNIRIRGSGFFRGDTPVFLLGVESSMLVYPWLYRLLGLDFVHVEDCLSRAVIRFGRTDNASTVYWEPYEWLDVNINLLLRNGLAVYLQPREENYNSNVQENPLYKDFPELFVNASHFIEYRFEGEAQRIRQNNWKAILQTSRRYPIFAYELFNEVLYSDYTVNVAGFRTAMKDKFSTIDQANKAWGTAFASFEQMEPPRTSSAESMLLTIKPVGFSRPLWVDWQKYTEEVFGRHLLDLGRYLKTVEKNPHAYLTVQSTCNISGGFSGACGVEPSQKKKAEDFFGDEVGGVYIPQEGSENYLEIRAMLGTLLHHDVVSNVCPDKPIVDEESGVGSSSRFPSPDSRLFELHGVWKFAVDNEKSGETRGYAAPDFKDSDWKDIKVPGMWGSQGFPDCTRGWYRKRFTMPAELKEKQIFLNGYQLTDFADVYVNGVMVHRTAEWCEKFGVDISANLRYGRENVIAIAIANNYRSADMYWGGIRENISLDDRNYSLTHPLASGQMRSWLWEKVIHGKSGVIMSYAYPSEGTNLSMFKPSISSDAIRMIPQVKKEIESVAEIVLPRPRIRGMVGLHYSFESGRASIPKSYEDWARAPVMKELLNAYASTLFNHVPMDVISNETILGDKLGGYRAVILRQSPRVRSGVPEKLMSYVQDGGVLMVDFGSLEINDDTHGKLDTTALTGIRVLETLQDLRPVGSRALIGRDVQTVARETDGATGANMEAVSATVLMSYADGRPAITEKKLGKGKVYFFASNFAYDDLEKIYASIFKANGIAGDLTVASKNGDRFIETHLLGGKGRQVLYAHNWGTGTKKVSIGIPGIADGNYSVRLVSSGEKLGGRETWSADELRSGIPVALASQDPAVLLIEAKEQKPLTMKNLDAAWLEKLSYLRPNPPAQTRVLVSSGKYENMTKIRMLTAVHLLEENGFEVNTLLDKVEQSVKTFTDRVTTESLSKYQVLVALGRGGFSDDETALLKDFVNNGGSLLVAGNLYVGPHGWMDTGAKGKLMKAFGVNLGNRNVRNPEDHLAPSDYLAGFTKIEKHPITTGVKVFQSLGMGALPNASPAAIPLICSGAGAKPANEPVMIAMEYGKGRIVVMGDSTWMEPTALAMADNAQLCLNIFRWLAHQEDSIAPITAAQKTMVTNALFGGE